MRKDILKTRQHFTVESLERRVQLASVPAGFTSTDFVSGFYNPTAMAPMPDGRILVTEQPGRLRVVKNDQLLTTPAVTVNVSFVGERGLLGVAVDPQFATNNYIYLYYTVPTGTVHNRISRFTFSGDLIDPATETPIFDLDPLTAEFHNAGALNFGVDGKLYVGVGDGATPSNAQSLNNTFGKVLRINKDGSIPSDNPFYNTATGNNRAIYAFGLRNPFTMAIQPGTGKIFANDVGQERVEEINDILPGKNYGWPEIEGPGTNIAYTNPVYAYNHVPEDGYCIAGGEFYNPTTVNFPAAYLGHYFFGDYVGGWIRQMDVSTGFVSTFATNIPNMVDVSIANDGSLLYLGRGFEYSNTGILGRIKYDSQSNQPPTITQQPAAKTVRPGEQAIFSVTATGTLPITYQWYRDNVAISGATGSTYTLSNAQLTDNSASFTVKITNNYGNITSQPAVLTVQNIANTAPVITQQPTDQTGAVGQTVTYSIIASGGNLTYQWYRNGAAVAGATGATWSKTIALSDNSMAVQCYVSNSLGQAQSVWVKLNLVGSPTLNPPTIVTHPANTSGATGATAYFTVDATSQVAMTYQWYKNGSAISGATASSLNYLIQSGDNNAKFTVAVTNSVGTVTSNEATLTVTSAGAPQIVTNPASQSIQFGQSATFSVVASGSAPLSYQWMRNGANITGATSSSYTFTPAITDDTAKYSVKVTNSLGSATSTDAILTVLSQTITTPQITQQPVDASAVTGTTASFSILATGGGLQYQWYRNGVAVSGATGATWNFTATIADTDMAVQCRVSNTAGTTWSNWTQLRLVTSVSIPVISQNPVSQSIALGQSVTFSVAATGAGLTYQWRKNNVAITGATSPTYSYTPTLADNGASFLCIVTNTAGSVSSQPATLGVTSTASQPPVPVITTPTVGLTWVASDTINFSGSATDPEEGSLPASAFSWVVIFHHDTHTHPFVPPIEGVKSGSFSAPNNGHTESNIWYEIRLTVTDSTGNAVSVSRDVYPRTVKLNLETNIPGMSLKLDSQPQTMPSSVNSVINVIRTLEAPQTQVLNGSTYDFIGWSDGQPWNSRTIWTPWSDTTFRAMYQLRA